MLGKFAQRRWVVEEAGRVLSLVLDRARRRRLSDLRVAVMLDSFGLAPGEPSSAPASARDALPVADQV